MLLSDKISSQKWACAVNCSLIASAFQSVLETLPLVYTLSVEIDSQFQGGYHH